MPPCSPQQRWTDVCYHLSGIESAYRRDGFVQSGCIDWLELKANPGHVATFRIVANTTNTIITDPLDGDMTAVAAGGAAYSAALAVNHFALRGGAQVDLMDADQARADRRGRLRATTAEIVTGSWLSHPAANITNQYGLELIVDETLILDATSRIDVTARGYLGGLSGGNEALEGRTLGNTTEGGSTRRNGGSYGGSGAFGTAGGTVNALYGDLENPDEPGSGGGSSSDPAGSGGGVIRLYARDFVLNGQILANGGAGSSWGGGGSGGAIKINARNPSGSGSVATHGGNAGTSQPGGGGGGRIAIHYQNAASFSFENVAAQGGIIAYAPGANGTVFLQQTEFVPPEPLLAFVPVIYEIQTVNSTGSIQQKSAEALGTEIVVRWFASSGKLFVIESSVDLLQWTQESADIREIAVGRYEGRSARPAGLQTFYRIRIVENLPSPVTP